MSLRTFRIFDLDGTLSDPAVGIARSINFALQHHGYAPIDESDVSRYIGPPLDQSFASIVGDVSPDHIGALVSRFRERYADVGYSENILYPGIAEALQTLCAANVPLGLCTSKRVDFAESILRLFGIRQYFQFLSGGNIGIRKSDQLATLLTDGVIDKSSTMIGDRAVDVLAAKANELRSVGVLWGHGSFTELQAASPDALFEAPHELAKLVNHIG